MVATEQDEWLPRKCPLSLTSDYSLEAKIENYLDMHSL